MSGRRGVIALGQQPSDGTANAYKYTGKERDTESGLDYFGARYYSSMTGRFLSPDWAMKPEPVPLRNGSSDSNEPQLETKSQLQTES